MCAPGESASGAFYCYLLKVAALLASDTNVGKGFISVPVGYTYWPSRVRSCYLSPLLSLPDEIAENTLCADQPAEFSARRIFLHYKKKNVSPETALTTPLIRGQK